MSKDPALLFYTSDFLTGTSLLSHEQVGIYIRLLCILHQHGGSIDLPSFEAFIGVHVILKDKFIIQDGHVMQERLNKEIEKRSKKSNNMSDNAKIRWNKCKSNAKASNLDSGLHMLIEDVNAIENEGDNTAKTINTTNAKKPITYVKDHPPELEEVRAYCLERNNGIDPQGFIDKNTTIGWLDKNKIPYRDWKAVIRVWENYRKSTESPKLASPTKRPVAIVVMEKIAAKMSNGDILQELAGKYTEHEINEAIMRGRGELK